MIFCILSRGVVSPPFYVHDRGTTGLAHRGERRASTGAGWMELDQDAGASSSPESPAGASSGSSVAGGGARCQKSATSSESTS